LVDKVVDLLVRPQGYIVAALDIAESCFGGGAESLDLGLVFPLALLQQAKALTNHLACVAEATGVDAGLDEVVWPRLSSTFFASVLGSQKCYKKRTSP